MPDSAYRTEVAIVGGGIAGITTALELLKHDCEVLLLDRDRRDQFGGLARWSFGGIFFVDTPQQRFLGIDDSPELALQDWHSFAEFDEDDTWPRRWAKQYVHRCTEEVYRWLRDRGLHFLPVVHWVERGLYEPGNSVPRFHMVWGTGQELTTTLIGDLRTHRNADRCTTHFRHHVTDLERSNGRVSGVRGVDERTDTPFRVEAEHVVIAAGGICGDIERLKQHWHPDWGTPPETILNGSHRYADGTMHDAAAEHGANVTHLDRQWLYAAGVEHPDGGRGKPYDALSIVPPKSALWVNHRGERIGPPPLVSGYDTRDLVQQIGREEKQYSWQVMNWEIATTELAISGSEYNDAMREKRPARFLWRLLTGADAMVQDLIDRCPDVVAADTFDGLVREMNRISDDAVDGATLRRDIERYDAHIERGAPYHNDEQLRRIAHLRNYRGDRVRTCKEQTILDPDATPLIAIREFILSRKSLGGVQTDLDGRVLQPPAADGSQEPIPGLYAVGEAAGFGGGCIHGLRSLEGTFLGTCILGGRLTGQAIADGG